MAEESIRDIHTGASSNYEHIESPAASLAVGENVQQSISDSTINVVSGNHNVINIIVETPNESHKNRFGYSKSITISGERIGGDAKVYKGRCVKRNIDLAIKIMHKCPKSEREAKLLLNLDHENIVKVFEVGDYPDDNISQIFIAMELCPVNLADYIENNKHLPFDFQTSFNFSKQLVTAVVYLHKRHIVHRDLKPWNILISDCGEKIKLTDMGLSRTVDIGKTATAVTHIYAGSNGFKAPETYESNAMYHLSSDIFPLGINIYFVFSNGKHPFGDDPLHWASNIKKKKKTNLTKMPTLKSKKMSKLVTLLKDMLKPDHGSRPTAEQVLQNKFFQQPERQRRAVSETEIQKDAVPVEVHETDPEIICRAVEAEAKNMASPTVKRDGSATNPSAARSGSASNADPGSRPAVPSATGLPASSRTPPALRHETNVKVPTSQEAERSHAENLAVFQNRWDQTELTRINVGERVLFDALESPDYLEAMCESLVGKTHSSELKEMLRSLRLLSDIMIEDIAKENRYDHKEMRWQLLSGMRSEQGLRLTPRTLLNEAYSYRIRKPYDDLCKAFLEHLRLKQDL